MKFQIAPPYDLMQLFLEEFRIDDCLTVSSCHERAPLRGFGGGSGALFSAYKGSSRMFITVIAKRANTSGYL